MVYLDENKSIKGYIAEMSTADSSGILRIDACCYEDRKGISDFSIVFSYEPADAEQPIIEVVVDVPTFIIAHSNVKLNAMQKKYFAECARRNAFLKYDALGISPNIDYGRGVDYKVLFEYESYKVYLPIEYKKGISSDYIFTLKVEYYDGYTFNVYPTSNKHAFSGKVDGCKGYSELIRLIELNWQDIVNEYKYIFHNRPIFYI